MRAAIQRCRAQEGAELQRQECSRLCAQFRWRQRQLAEAREVQAVLQGLLAMGDRETQEVQLLAELRLGIEAGAGGRSAGWVSRGWVSTSNCALVSQSAAWLAMSGRFVYCCSEHSSASMKND